MSRIPSPTVTKAGALAGLCLAILCAAVTLHAAPLPDQSGPQAAPQAADWQALRRQSSALYMQRDLKGAIAAETQALAIAEADSPYDPRVAKGVVALANLHRLQGDPAAAIPFYRRAIAIHEHGPADPRIFIVYKDLADTYRRLGDTASADKYQALSAAAR